jgi:group I intron endonuclease
MSGVILNNKSGIYKIINVKNNKIYVGSAVNLRRRKNGHLMKLRKNEHKNIYLQNSFNKYGEENFKFEVIEYVDDKNNLIKREQYWIDFLNVCDKNIGYNINPIAGSSLGVKRSNEFKKKLSDFLKVSKRPISEETKKKISKTLKDNKLLHNSRKPLSEETKEKISKANSGENHPCAKLTKDDVNNIKELISNNLSCDTISKIFNVTKQTIYNIKSGKTWKNIA